MGGSRSELHITGDAVVRCRVHVSAAASGVGLVLIGSLGCMTVAGGDADVTTLVNRRVS